MPVIKALAVVATAAILLAAGLVNLQIRAVEAQDVSEDRGTLVTFYNATGGDSWTNNANWLSSTPIRDWHGVTTDGSGRVNL